MNGRAPNSSLTALKNSAPGPGMNCPVRAVLERSEMIQPDYIHQSKKSTQALNEESEARATEGIPIVDRIAP
jgi:hypothetical protein